MNPHLASNEHARDTPARTRGVPPAADELLLRACAWCDRVHVDDDWISEESAVQNLRTFDLEAPPRFTHTICPDCFERVERQRAEHHASRVRAA
jgi:hypothetical protein